MGNSIPRELEAKAFLISRFQESRAELTMDLYRMLNNLFAQSAAMG
jgi:hypothetical protein